MKDILIVKLSKRTVRFEFEEFPDKINVSFSTDRIGELGDDEEMERVLWPLLESRGYDNDPRPLVFTRNKERVTIYGDSQHHVAQFEKLP